VFKRQELLNLPVYYTIRKTLPNIFFENILNFLENNFDLNKRHKKIAAKKTRCNTKKTPINRKRPHIFHAAKTTN